MQSIFTTRVLLTILGASLLGLSLPRAIDSGLELTIGSAARSATQASDQAASLEAIDRIWHDPLASLRAGALRFQSAAATTHPDRAALDRAIADLQNGLLRAPADPRAWMLLALAHEAEGDQEGARRALRSSILIASYDPALLLPRAQLGLKLAPTLGADDLDLVNEQIRMAADHQFDGLVALGRSSGAIGPILTALAGDPDRAAALSAAMANK